MLEVTSKVTQRSNIETWWEHILGPEEHVGSHHFDVKGHPEVKYWNLVGTYSRAWGTCWMSLFWGQKTPRGQILKLSGNIHQGLENILEVVTILRSKVILLFSGNRSTKCFSNSRTTKVSWSLTTTISSYSWCFCCLFWICFHIINHFPGTKWNLAVKSLKNFVQCFQKQTITLRCATFVKFTLLAPRRRGWRTIGTFSNVACNNGQ